MTLLSDMRKVANTVALKKKQEEQQTKAKTTTTTTKKTTNLTQEQKQQAINSINNIKSQWIAKWSMTNAKQWAETQAEKSFYNRSTDKEINAYKTMISEWYTPAEARKAIDTVTTQKRTVTTTRPKWWSDLTDKQKSAFDTLVSEWYSEKEAKKAVQKAIQKDWDTWKKARVATKAFWQWVSDVWQRTVGRAVWYGTDKMESKLDQRYENSEWFKNAVDRVSWKLKKGLNAIWVTDADIQEFQKSEAIRKEQGIPSTYWSILSDEEASSRIWTVWRKSWQIAWTTALSMAAWWVAGGWARAIWTAAWSKALWWLAWVVLWAWEWALSTDIYTRAVEDRRATWKEALGWAVVWWVLGGIWGYRATAKALNAKLGKYWVDETSKLTRSEKKIASMIQDTSNKGKTQAIRQWRTTAKWWLWNKTQVQELSQSEKNAAKFINKNNLASSDPQKMYNNINKSISDTAKSMSDDMKKIKIDNSIKDDIKNYIDDIKKISDNAQTHNWIKKLDAITKQIDNASNADDLWKIRQSFDDLFTENQKVNINWTYDAIQNVRLDWRWTLTKAINTAAEQAWDDTTKAWMKYLSNMINARENLLVNTKKLVWKSVPTKLKKIVTRWWLGWWWLYAWNKTKKFLSGN